MLDSGLRLAKVVRAYPGGHSVDLVMYDDNSPQTNVQVLSPMASSRSGISGLASPTPPPDGEWGGQDSGDEDIIAVVGYLRGHPIVLGFLFPQVGQMTIDHENRVTIRTPADVYFTCDKDGNTELYHPSGTYLRIGKSKQHEDLTKKDFDKKWKIDRNTDSAVHVRLGVSNAGNEVASLHFDPNGNVNFQCDKNKVSRIDGRWEVKVEDTTFMQSGGTTTIKAPLIVLDGEVQTTKNVRIDRTLSVGMDIVSDAEVACNGGDIAMSKHVHTGVVPGPGNTGTGVIGGGSAGLGS